MSESDEPVSGPGAPVPADRSAPADAQRRFLTIVFSDLSDSSRLAGSIENELYAELLVALRHAYRSVVAKHGGSVARIQGDGMLAIFGFPQAREDSARRATQAALELHETVRDLRLEPGVAAHLPLGLHTGIHSGLVLVSEGDLLRGQVDLVGDAPNIAWRLSDLAGKDEILVSETTLGPENQLFHTGERQFISLKGRAESIAVRRILARAPIDTRFEASIRRGLTSYVGRQLELQALEHAAREADAGVSRCVALVAPPGVGKTRLAEEFLRRHELPGVQIYRGYCEDSLSAEPFQPFLQMLKSLFGLDRGIPGARAVDAVSERLAQIGPGLAVHRAVLLRVLSLHTEGGADAGRRPAAEDTIAALHALFCALASDKPMILLIDDWQWADSATRQVLAAIRDGERRAILILLTARAFSAVDAARGNAQILSLAPLNESEAAQTIGELLPGADPFVAANIQRQSGGNPLYIEELCHSAAYDRAGRGARDPPGGAVWLDSLIESRFARLDATQAELARVAAVIGNVVPAWLLEAITGYPDDHPLVRSLAEQDFIFPAEPPGTLRFKHGITRDAIYAGFGLHKRQVMHLRVATVLREHSMRSGEAEHYEALAYHYAAGGDAGAAARFAELAGDKATAASALDRAQAQYRAALDALDQLATTADNYLRWSSIAQRLGLVCVFDPSSDQLPVFDRAVRLATQYRDQAGIARSEYWLGYLNYALGELRPAIRHLELAMAAAPSVLDDPLILWIRATLGQARASAGDYPGALVLLDEAIEVGRRRRARARPAAGFSYTLACKGVVLGDRGQFDAAHDCFEDALDVVRGANHEVEASVLGWRSAVYLWQGRWEDAVRCAIEGQRVGERVRSLFIYAADRALGAFGSWSLEHSSTSLQAIVDATAWLEAGDRRLSVSLNYGWLAEAMFVAGRMREMRIYAARALMRARSHERLGLAMACRALARAAARHGERASARRYLALATRAAQLRESRHEAAVNHLCEAGLSAGWGERDAARALLDQAESGFEVMRMDWHLASAQRLRASL